MKSRIPRKPRTPATPPPLGDKSQTKSSQGPQPTLRYGDQFGKYVINGFAGKGATSFVYEARPVDGFEKVAVKVLHPHLLADPAKRRKFYQEARIMMRMRHANVVNFREIMEIDGHLAYVMEYIDGPTLEDWMRTRAKSASQMELACLFSDILRGLSHAHSHGVVHRDIKPANILIATQQGRLVAKVIDFGLARFSDQPISAQERSKIAGTAAYISPEEVSDPDSVGQTSDIYSLGVMLYEAACGQRPFAEEDPRALLEAHANRMPPSPREVNPALSPEFENVILRTLSKRPDSRFNSAPEMIQALQDAIQAAMRAEMMQLAEENAATTEWTRDTPAKTGPNQQTAMLLYLMMCMRAMFAVLGTSNTSSDTTDSTLKAHHLDRTPDPSFHLPLNL
ncbi:serine/threonine protein kinase [Bradymonas sediminis]|nr:serine/threonine-protein kinase [Bradymonas sediminis]TDP77458.1 serine/threonine protein kinase [Bradymonas sediminis]